MRVGFASRRGHHLSDCLNMEYMLSLKIVDMPYMFLGTLGFNGEIVYMIIGDQLRICSNTSLPRKMDLTLFHEERERERLCVRDR